MIDQKYSHYTHLAELFDFPGAEFIFNARLTADFLQKKYSKCAVELDRFINRIPEAILDLQELYIRTFDVQSITTLDIGYVLFGDDYKRAELMSNLTREHQLVKTNLKGELADHLPNILRLLPNLKDKELLNELVKEILVPALMLMIREFDSERIEKKNTNYQTHYKTLIDGAPGGNATIYGALLKMLLNVLIIDFEVTDTVTKLLEWSSRPNATDFLGQVKKEMEIEINSNPVNSGNDS